MKRCPNCGKDCPNHTRVCPQCYFAFAMPGTTMYPQVTNQYTRNQPVQQQYQQSQPMTQEQAQLEMQRQQLAIQQQQLALQQQQMANQAHCPRCGSTSLSGNKKGFGVGKAVVGAAIASPIAWPIGLVAGNIGAKKVRVTCMNCGYSFKR